MTEPNPAAGATGASAAQAPTAPTATPPQPAPAQPAGSQDPEPGWLNERLKRAEASAQARLLQQLGVAKLEDAQSVLAAHKSAEDAKKSDAEKFAATSAELERAKARAQQLEESTKTWATAEMAKLDAAKQGAVTAIAGDDPAAQLKAIAALAPTWGQPAAPAAAAQSTAAAGATGAAATQQAAAPATSAPPANAPDGNTPTQSPVDHKAVYERLTRENPWQANIYARDHAREIFPNT